MIKWLKALMWLIGIPLVLFGLYKFNYPTYSWHQKLTVEIETPQGVISGSSVVAVSWSRVPQFLPDVNPFSNEITGEATVVDLGNGKYLFALLKGASTLAQRTFVTQSVGYSTDAWLYPAGKVGSHFGKKAIIKSENYPLFVTFTDINDPKTVKRVWSHNLDAAFGCSPSVAGQASATSGSVSPRTGGGADAPAKNQKCYSLKSITLEITDEPVTKGVVEGVINWLSQYPEPGLCKATGRSSNIPFCRRVHHGDLIRR